MLTLRCLVWSAPNRVRAGRVQAKKFVEEAPKVLKDAASKDEAAKIKADLEKLGAKISVE